MGSRALAMVTAFALGAVSCGVDLPPAQRTAAPVARGSDVILGGIVAGGVLAALPDGGVLVGARGTGDIISIGASGDADPVPVARVPVSAGGEHGLLGLAVDQEGRVFASWTDRNGRLVVGQVAPGDVAPVWSGPSATADQVGGGLAVDREGRLLIGVGAMGVLSRANDPSAPFAKVLRLDPARGPEQEPAIMSTGWRDPIAFASLAEGEHWVLDRRGDEPPVLGSVGDGLVTSLGSILDAAGLGALDANRVLICDRDSGALRSFRVRQHHVSADEEPIAHDCAGGIARLADGRVAYVSDAGVRALLL